MGRGGLWLTIGAAAVAQAAAAVPAQGAPRVRVMVVGRSDLLLAPRTVAAGAVTVRASGRPCAAGAGTPLAALAGARRAGGPGFRVRDYGGSCSRRAADGAGLFVFQVGPDRNRGRDGWVYKVGGRLGTAGAGDPGGPFGRGLLRSGQHVTWFWCRMSRRGSCQRTLSVRPAARRVRAGGRLAVTVFGFDDRGRRARVAGARVLLGGRSARSGRDGVALLRAPGRRGRVRLTATRRGMVRAFDTRVRVT